MSRQDDEVTGLSLSARAQQVAIDLGYGPSGKRGGVILVVVDHDAGQSACVHAGGCSPMFEALLFAVNALVSRAAELLGGGTGKPSVSSVRRWRVGKKS